MSFRKMVLVPEVMSQTPPSEPPIPPPIKKRPGWIDFIRY